MFAQLPPIEVELRRVHVCPAGQRGAAVIAPRDPADGHSLWIDLQHHEAHVLAHELAGEETSRSQAISLTNRIAQVLQGGVVGALLIQCHEGCLRAAIQVRTPDALVEVPTEPGQALAAAVCLHIPLLADRRLFVHSEEQLPPISGSVASFLESLDLSSLNEGES